MAPAPQLLALIGIGALAATSLLGSSFDPTIRLSLIYLLAAVGLYVFAGLSGILAFGQVAFMSIGAYVTAICTMPPSLKRFQMADAPQALIDVHLSTVPALLLAGAVAAICAITVGIPLLRMSGLSAGLASFAVLVMVSVVAANWNAVTRGTAGMTGVPRVTTASSAFVWVAVAIVAATLFGRSRRGIRLRASREDDIAARASGIGVVSERCIAFVLSAVLMAIAGGLFAQQVGSFQPSSLYLDVTFLLIAMVIVGGFTSLSGAVVGSLLLTVVSEVLRQLERGPAWFGVDLPAIEGLRDVGLAVVMLAVLLLRPAGLVGAREIGWTAPSAAARVSLDRLVGKPLIKGDEDAGTPAPR